MEGYYKAGKEHGFFVHYDFGDGGMEDIEFYEDGVIKSRVKFYNGEMSTVEMDPCNYDYHMEDNQIMQERLEYPCK